MASVSYGVVALAAALLLAGCGSDGISPGVRPTAAKPTSQARPTSPSAASIAREHDAMPVIAEQESGQRSPDRSGGASPAPAERSVSARSLLDSGSPSGEGNVTALDWRLDQVSVTSEGAALRDVKITWTAGADFVAPAASRVPVKLGLLIYTTYDDPSVEHREVLHNVAGATYHEAYVEVTPHGPGDRLLLRGTHGASAMRGEIKTGPRPTLSLTGLPTGLQDFSFDTYGQVGPRLLATRGACRKGGATERISVTGHYADAASFETKATGDQPIVCPPAEFQTPADR